MPPNVSDMKKKAKASHLQSHYKRLIRCDIPSPEMRPTTFPSSLPGLPNSTYVALRESPLPGWTSLAEVSSASVLGRSNALLLYRVLERSFGQSDPLGMYVFDYEVGSRHLKVVPFTADWGFAFHLADDLVAEVRSQDRNTRSIVRLWADPEAACSQEDTRQLFDAFRRDLKNPVDRNLHLFSEKEALSEGKPPIPVNLNGTINVASEKYRAALRLLDASGIIEDTEEALQLRSPFVEERTRESLLLGAATPFIISLEAFINLVYFMLLKPDFQDRKYERLTTRADLDLRVLALHILCRGFARQPVTPGSPLWTQLDELRQFRNDLVHGNVTEEHQMHAIVEGPYTFYYAPHRDYRGPAVKKRPGRIARNTFAIDEDFVASIRSVVDQVHKAVIDALERPYQDWLKTWLDEDVIGDPPA